MLNKTSETALRGLLHVARSGRDAPVSPAAIAERVGASPSYMAKISTLLVKADILKTFRGMYGGVTLSRSPGEITLLEIVEACQGRILADYCQFHPDLKQVCAYHEAMNQLHSAVIETLGAWSLGDILARPAPDAALCDQVSCHMAIGHEN